MILLQNIINNFIFLQKDFLFISINLIGIGEFLLHLLIGLSVFVLFYFFGEKIRLVFFKEIKQFTFFLNIALGYIVIGTGLGILGFFSLLQPLSVVIYLYIVCVIAFYHFPLHAFKKINYKKLHNVLLPQKGLLMWGVVLFIFLAFLRLITPQIVEDGYHADNAKYFLLTHTTMHISKDTLHTIPFPQLPEMIYMIPILLGDKEATRVIHFGFYLLVIYLLFAITKEKKYSYAVFLPLLFVTTPVVIRNSPTQYTDFFAIFLFLLMVFFIGKNMTKKTIVLCGIFFGAIVGAKVWMLIYLPLLLLYIAILHRKIQINKSISILALFVGGYFLTSALWYIRAYLLTGNPVFPILNTFFIKELGYEVSNTPYLALGHYLGFNSKMFAFENLSGLSPFFFLGVVSLLVVFHHLRKTFYKIPLVILFFLLTFQQLFTHIEYGRYLVIWCLITSFFVSAGMLELYRKSKLYRYGFIALFTLFFSYYGANTFLALPYGFGWADSNNYLTRILGRDNVSYYDFNKDFRKWITEKDLVAMYGIGNFYYVDFSYIEVGYVLEKPFDSLETFRKKGVTKLFIMGGDFEWFCKQVELRDCKPESAKLLASYPADIKKYNLYLLQY